MEKDKKLILFMPSIDGGGVEKNLILISNYLSKKIDDINLITYDNRFNNYFDKKINIFNIKKKKIIINKYHKYFSCLYLLIKILFSSKKKVLVFSFQANIYCAILSVIFGFNLIVRSNSSPSGWSQGFIKKKIFSCFMKITDQVIVNSYEFQKELFLKLGINSTVIYNPLNLKEIKKNSKEKNNFKFFNNKKTLKIINVARFTHQKDHITLLKAFKIVSKQIKTKLLIIGYGPEKKNMQDFIKENNLSKDVKILNFQKNPYKFIIKADVLVLTSKFEGLPNVLLEALSLKKFVISSNCPTGPKEILGNGKYGLLFKVGEYKKLSEKIIDYSINKRKYNKMILEGYISLHRFNFKKNCHKYFKLLKTSLI